MADSHMSEYTVIKPAPCSVTDSTFQRFTYGDQLHAGTWDSPERFGEPTN